jgi:hypothetical protein
MTWKPNKSVDVLDVVRNQRVHLPAFPRSPRLSDEPSDDRRVDRAQQTSERWHEPDDVRPRR